MTRAALACLCVVAWLLLPRASFAQGMGSFVSPGPLAAPHAEIDTLTGCTECHAPAQGPAPDRCMRCHDDVREQVSTSSGFHANKGTNCQKCHPEHRGRDFPLVRIEQNDFDHSQTRFPLEGAHARAECSDCHTKAGEWKGLKTECVACHDDPHGASKSKRSLLDGCESCHDAEAWSALPLAKSIFDHENAADTDYILEFTHLDVDCESCHFEWTFVPIDHELCIDCHENPHRASFKEQKCETCHPSPRGWSVANFNHDRTGYLLRGEHTKVACRTCHGDDTTAPLKHATCEDCHRDVHRGQFAPRKCDECHAIDIPRFEIPNFDHNRTDFPLVGNHETVRCDDCHTGGAGAKYNELPHDDCDVCHTDAHSGKYEPTRCAACHTPEGFLVKFFSHDNTAFPHTGQHVGLDCPKCHVPGRWNGIPHDSCNDCHSARNPHQGYAADACTNCHVTTGFADMVFPHAKFTHFDLAPAHTTNECVSCHGKITRFEKLDPSCANCHRDDTPWGHYEGDCGDCHRAQSWSPGGLGTNDHSVTGFALHGTHALTPCESCHADGDARGLANPDCVSCHAADDPHRHMLGDTCSDCHSDTNWFRTRWRHDWTGWPLRGSHKLAPCNDCHALGYIGTPTDCWRCHEAQAPPLPQHQTVLFSQCDVCHRPFTWAVPNFPH